MVRQTPQPAKFVPPGREQSISWLAAYRTAVHQDARVESPVVPPGLDVG